MAWLWSSPASGTFAIKPATWGRLLLVGQDSNPDTAFLVQRLECDPRRIIRARSRCAQEAQRFTITLLPGIEVHEQSDGGTSPESNAPATCAQSLSIR